MPSWRFFSTVTSELADRFASLSEAKMELFDYIEVSDTNFVARDMLRRIRTSLTFGNSKANEVSFRSPRTHQVYAPEWNGQSVEVDYGVIIRSQNPFATDRSVLLMFGCYGYGTRAAGRFVCSDEFLRLAEVEKGGGDLECVVRTEVIGGAPQRASLCEIRPLAGVQHVQSG
jgi:hypothetical protein